MTRLSDKTESNAQSAAADAPTPEGGNDEQQSPDLPAGGDRRQQIELDDSKVSASYANFCRVTGTPEELIVDLGLNSQPAGVPTNPIVINQRIILNHYTTKRLLAALQMSIQRHEGVFGVLETDIQKRMQPGFVAEAPKASG